MRLKKCSRPNEQVYCMRKEGGGRDGRHNQLSNNYIVGLNIFERRWSCNKNGFWEWPFLGSRRTPEYGIHLRMAICGPAKVRWGLKGCFYTLMVIFELKYDVKNGFGEWPFLGSRRTPEFGIHLRMATWRPAKVRYGLKWCFYTSRVVF